MKLKYKVKVDISGGYQLHAFLPGILVGKDDYLCVHIPFIPAGSTLEEAVSESLMSAAILLGGGPGGFEDLTDWEELKRVDALRSPARGGLTRPATKEDIDLQKFTFTEKPFRAYTCIDVPNKDGITLDASKSVEWPMKLEILCTGCGRSRPVGMTGCPFCNGGDEVAV